MIHITIPTTRICSEYNNPKKKFHSFDFYINGAFHASIRYSHLNDLHEKLIENFGFRLKTTFPPKKLRHFLNPKELNERRCDLTNYFQELIQNPDICKHYILEKNFLDFQVNSFNPVTVNIAIDVYNSFGDKVTIKCNIREGANTVLKYVVEKFKIDLTLINHFALFLGHERYKIEDRTNPNDILIRRWLKNYESPYVSLQLLNQKTAKEGIFYKIFIRKVIWDPSIEEQIMFDSGALNIMYLQAVTEFKNKHMPTNKLIEDRLHELIKEESKVQFLRLCHLQSTYGYEYLKNVKCDYPKPNTECELKMGRREIVLTWRNDNIGEESVTFRTTRIRIWRIVHNFTVDNIHIYSFNFEYLLSPGEFRWISIETDQTILISCLLQSMSIEILQESKNMGILINSDNLCKKTANNLEKIKEQSIGNQLEENNEHYETFEDIFDNINDGIPLQNRNVTSKHE
ncbi:Sorting nexin-17 [Strongyloides ratti]|uniref:Sorting nexin-17 n=1 Tax=Strongyloides ratti TaxID=34506 RepID=A0A090MW51_STRRB|nr:Sorting nexin-17 [Strongyloides ratti]CEF63433.1 Sorting nexin-17 [Strongyloides ratti]